MTIKESPRPPGLFSTAMCAGCYNAVVSDDQGHPMTRDTIEGPEKQRHDTGLREPPLLIGSAMVAQPTRR